MMAPIVQTDPLATAIALSNCQTTRYIPLPEHHTRDSIPYPVEVPVEVPTPIPRMYIHCTIGFFLLLLALFAFIALRLNLRR